MSIGTEYSRKDLQRLAKAEACAVRQETAAPVRLVDWTIGAVGTDRVYLKVLVRAYDGFRQRSVAI